MKDKVLALLGSIRFWIYTLSAAGIYLGVVEVNGFVLSELFTAIGGWLGVVGVTGGLDKWFAKK